MCRAWASGGVTRQRQWCYSLLFERSEVLFTHPLPAHKTSLSTFDSRTHKRNETLSHAPFVLYFARPTNRAHTSVARRPAISTRPQQRGLRVVDLRRHALHLRRRVLSAIRRRRVLRRGRLLRLHPFAPPLVESARLTRGRRSRCQQPPSNLTGARRRRSDNTTERNCRTVCIVAKTNGPKRLMV